LIVGGLTRNPQVSKQVERMIILSRGDAKEILKVQADAHEEPGRPPAQADTAGTDSNSTVSTLEAVPDDQHVQAS